MRVNMMMDNVDTADQQGDVVARAGGSGDTPINTQVHTFDLTEEMERAQRAEGWRQGKHSARTLLKAADLRLALITMHAGDRIDEHRAPGPISIHALSGHIRVTAAKRATDLSAGHVLTLERDEPYAVEALADSAFLLTIAWPAAAGARP